MLGTYTPTTLDEIAELLADVREVWGEFQEQVDQLKAAMRRSPALHLQLERIEAYGALEGRDEGAGQSMEGWLDEIAAEIEIEKSAAEMDEEDAR